jgi:phosphatidylglycerol:prolipoprotein diacylglycerol transferase
MHPILWHLDSFRLFGMEMGPFDLHSYGVMVAMGFVLTTWIGIRFGRQEKIPASTVFDFGFWVLLAGVVGSRLLFSLVNIEHYANACFHPELPNPLNNGMPLHNPDCWSALSPWGGGLVWYGGLIAGIGAGWLFVRRKKLSFAMMADIGLGAAPLGHAVGRLGCLLAGCCWGRPTDSLFGLTFPEGALPYLNMGALTGKLPPIPLYPTQIYEALGELAIFWALLALRRYRRFHGQIALGFLVLYPLLRATVEFFRGDSARGLLVSWPVEAMVDGRSISILVGFSVSQLISVLVAAAALLWMRKLVRARG